MSDTTNKLYYYEPPVDTRPDNDTEEIINQYINTLETIFETDEELKSTINKYYGDKND